MRKSRWWTQFYYRYFKLGGLYLFRNRIVKFIKVTPKGFNLLDLESNCCILKNHLYSRDWARIEIPLNVVEVKNVKVPNWCILKTYKQSEKMV